MKRAVFFYALMALLVWGCGQDEKSTSEQNSDHRANGGVLRFTLAGKNMHDRFFGAQFTPRGDLFKLDNLQLYNYQIGSEKFPKFLISIDYKESDLKKWQGQVFPLDFLAFTPDKNAPPMGAEGRITLSQVNDSFVQGNFQGELIHPKSKKRFPLRGEFKAKLEINR